MLLLCTQTMVVSVLTTMATQLVSATNTIANAQATMIQGASTWSNKFDAYDNKVRICSRHHLAHGLPAPWWALPPYACASQQRSVCVPSVANSQP